MRIRTTLVAALLALGVLAPQAAHAQACYDVSVTVNGDAIVDEAGCTP